MWQDDTAEATRDWLAEVQELLLTGGYFRARIANLAPFDKARDPPRTRKPELRKRNPATARALNV